MSESDGYMGFVCREGEILGRVTVASFDFDCPRCGIRVMAHEMHGKDNCQKWDAKDSYLPLDDDGAINYGDS